MWSRPAPSRVQPEGVPTRDTGMGSSSHITHSHAPDIFETQSIELKDGAVNKSDIQTSESYHGKDLQHTTSLQRDSARKIPLPRSTSQWQDSDLSLARTMTRTTMGNQRQHTLWSSDLKTLKDEEPLHDMYVDEILESGEKMYKPKETNNIRAKMAKPRLLWHDFKAWYIRRQYKQDNNPLLKKSIETVEGRFGSGILSFFVFSRWTILLNLSVACVWLCLVVLPWALWFDYKSMSHNFYLHNIFDGQDAMGSSWVFFGSYQEKAGHYPLALMYLATIVFTYFGSFFVILRSIAVAMQQEGVSIKISRYSFALTVWASWDYSLQSAEAVRNLTMGITNSLRDRMHEIHTKRELHKRSRKQKYQLYAVRSLAWLLTVILIALGCGGIAYIVHIDFPSVIRRSKIHRLVATFLSQFGTPIAFSLVNVVIPFVLFELPRMEKYLQGQTELVISVSRVFVLRSASLFALLASIYTQAKKGSLVGCAGTILGQELYKIVIVDTLIQGVSEIVTHFVRYYWTGKQMEFKMPPAVLQIVNRQALVWTGTLVCPLLPLVGALSLLTLFFINFVVVTRTCKPPQKRWNQARHSTFFMALLAFMLVPILILISIIISRNDIMYLGKVGGSSMTCGPFGNGTMVSALATFQEELQQKHRIFGLIINFMTSSAVVVPLLFIILALLYFQQLRIKWEKDRKDALETELKKERADNKDLVKKLHAALEIY